MLSSVGSVGAAQLHSMHDAVVHVMSSVFTHFQHERALDGLLRLQQIPCALYFLYLERELRGSPKSKPFCKKALEGARSSNWPHPSTGTGHLFVPLA